MIDIIYKYILKCRENRLINQDLFEFVKNVYENMDKSNHELKWKIMDELSIIAFVTDNKKYSLELSDKLLQEECFPETERHRITTFNRSYNDNDEMTKNASKKIWDDSMKKIQEPPVEKTVWARPTQKTKLSVVMIEPRCHEDLKPVLWNMAHVYGGTETSLYIFHGTKNIEYLKDITGSWKNVEYINMGVENLKWEDYSYKLTTYEFWNTIKTEYALIFQTDTIIFKQIPENFFKYDYLGAYAGVQKLLNGGFSLRKISTMKEVTKRIGPEYPKGFLGAEDSYFSYYVHDSPNCKGVYPEFSITSQFSVERFFRKNPVGCHKPWQCNSSEIMKCLLENVPGYQDYRPKSPEWCGF